MRRHQSELKTTNAMNRGREKHPDRLERHSGTGIRGLSKKGWGKLDEQTGTIILDKNDPNYQSDDEEKTFQEKPDLQNWEPIDTN